MIEKSPRTSTAALVRGLREPVAETEVEPPKVERLDERGMRRQTLYLPPLVYEQIREIAIYDRISQQKLFKSALDREFKARGLKLWDELEKTKRTSKVEK